MPASAAASRIRRDRGLAPAVSGIDHSDWPAGVTTAWMPSLDVDEDDLDPFCRRRRSRAEESAEPENDRCMTCSVPLCGSNENFAPLLAA